MCKHALTFKGTACKHESIGVLNKQDQKCMECIARVRWFAK